MGYQTPTLVDAVQRTRDRMRAELPGTDAAIWPNTNYVDAKVVGGEAWELYQHLDWIAKQRFVNSCDGDMLDAAGVDIGVARRPASYAFGTINIVGTPGFTLNAGTQIDRSDGALYATNTDLMLDQTGLGSVGVTAVATGAGSNCDTGIGFSPLLASSDIGSIVSDANGIGGGADVEGNEPYRARLLFRLQNPPRGGATADYVAWALSIPGITRVWVDALAYGHGTVGIWVMADGNGSQYGVPSGSVIAEVQAYINSVKPSGCRLALVRAPYIAPLNVTLSGIRNPSTTLQQTIAQELADVFLKIVPVSTPNAPATVKAALLWQAVARATGRAGHSIVAPADTPLPVNYLAALGVVNYV